MWLIDVLPSQMWKSVVGHNVSMKVADKGDDWETDPDFEVLPGYYVSLSCVCVCVCWLRMLLSQLSSWLLQNDVSEQEQRWGAKTIEGSGRKEHIR